ncbi:MAG TPA: hypothetical protein PKV71_14020 [Calditrichia bacterium]|nr:hypothetical protein [Calditrichota bacterium]HQU72224.1 hypothetical protein [Calditrichia bacterium]HQV32997.1 hypothetical protein [Calditrichia bacterium]
MAKHAEAVKVDYDNWCRCCAFYEFDDNRGILCGITREKPAFGAECATFEYDANRDRKSSTTAVKSRIKNNRKKMFGVALFWAAFSANLIIFTVTLMVSGIALAIMALGAFLYLRWKLQEIRLAATVHTRDMLEKN